METYLIQKETLVNIANKVRELSVVEDELSLIDIQDLLNNANIDVHVEAQLIEQIISALKDKTLGSGNNVVEVCPSITVSIESSPWPSDSTQLSHLSYYFNGERQVIIDHTLNNNISMSYGDTYTFYNIDTNSPIVLIFDGGHLPYVTDYASNINLQHEISTTVNTIIVFTVVDKISPTIKLTY